MPIPSNPTLVKFHPLANLFPLIEGEEFDELVTDIKQYGLRERITVYEDMVLDGRNRFRACKDAGVEPTYTHFSGSHAEAIAFVISANIRRRHLTPGQKLALITKLLRADPSKSDRAVAKTAGASPSTVAAVCKSNVQLGHKDRVEASGRKARGRKPTTTSNKLDGPPRPPPPPVAAKPTKQAAPAPVDPNTWLVRTAWEKATPETKRLFVESNAAELRQLLVADKAVESTMPPPLAPIQDDAGSIPDFLDRSHKLN